NKTSVMLGLLVCALGISVSSSADARKANRQGTYVGQGYPNLTPSITAMPRNTPKANIVCWTPVWPAGGHCDGRRSRSIHSLADSARREWLLWRHQVGRSAPGRSLPQLLRRPSRRPRAPSAAPGDTRGIDRARVLISREGKCICDGRPRLELNRRFTVVVAGAAWVLCAVSAHAGPCTTAIAQFERAVRQSANNPDAGPMAPQSIGAQLNRQPTPGSM